VESGNEMSNQYKRAFGKNLCVIVVSRDENNIGLEFAKDILYYEDKNDFLRTELKFSHTPKILLLDKNNNILYCFDVTIDKDKMEEHYHNLTELISKRN